jgi:hypothetical protein
MNNQNNDTPTKSSALPLEISQASQNNGILAQIFHKGIMSGQINLVDPDNIATIRAFALSMCSMNQLICNIYSKVNTVSPFISPVRSIEFDSTKKPANNSVHNSDVTNDSGHAHEQSLHQWVSEFAEEEVSDDGSAALDLEYVASESRKRRNDWQGRVGSSKKKHSEMKCVGGAPPPMVCTKYFTSIDEIKKYLDNRICDKTNNVVSHNGKCSLGNFLIVSHCLYIC